MILSGIVLTAFLGRWQLHRASEKHHLLAQLEIRSQYPPLLLKGAEQEISTFLFRKLEVHGRFLSNANIFLDNQIRDSKVGYAVFTPLLIQKNLYILINRGWIQRDQHYPQTPIISTPFENVIIEGIGALPPQHFLELSAQSIQGNVWENFTFERYRKQTGLNVLPILIEQTNGTSGDGIHMLKHNYEKPDLGVSPARHQAYAFQWFGLSVTMIVFIIIFNIRTYKKFSQKIS